MRKYSGHPAWPANGFGKPPEAPYTSQCLDNPFAWWGSLQRISVHHASPQQLYRNHRYRRRCICSSLKREAGEADWQRAWRSKACDRVKESARYDTQLTLERVVVVSRSAGLFFFDGQATNRRSWVTLSSRGNAGKDGYRWPKII